MIESVLRDEFVLGAIITGSTDRLTQYAIEHFGFETNGRAYRGIVAAVVNVGVLYLADSVPIAVPGIIYGCTQMWIHLTLPAALERFGQTPKRDAPSPS